MKFNLRAWRDTVRHPGYEVGAIEVDRWVDFSEVRDVMVGRNTGAIFARYHRAQCSAFGICSRSEGPLGRVCLGIGATGLTWTTRRIEWGTLWCSETDIGA